MAHEHRAIVDERVRRICRTVRPRISMWADARFDGLMLEHVELGQRDMRSRLHDRYALLVTAAGTGVIRSEGVDHHARPGSAYLFCPYHVWSARAISVPWCYETLYIDGRSLRVLMDQLDLGADPRLPVSGMHHLGIETSDAVRHVFVVFGRRGSVLERVVALIGLASSLAAGSRPEQTGQGDTTVSRIRQFLTEHATEPLPLSHLAKLFGLTPSHLIRQFREVVGVPPHRYATLVRLCRAEQMIRTGVPICEAAIRAGFCDQSHLNRCSRRLLGVTPGDCRKVTFFRQRPLITGERAMAYRLRSGMKLWRFWITLRAIHQVPIHINVPTRRDCTWSPEADG